MDSKHNMPMLCGGSGRKKWYGLFSHTGKELYTLACKAHDWGMQLDAAITSNMNYDNTLRKLGIQVHKLATTADVSWLLRWPQVIQDNSLITLNGYMGILPKDVLDNLRARGCKVYNIHPAPIQLYPELRGKDPQERLYEGVQNRQFSYIGVVIHEVDEEVDTGKIVHWIIEMADHGMTKTEMDLRLRDLGIRAWERFFAERMYEDGTNP